MLKHKRALRGTTGAALLAFGLAFVPSGAHAQFFWDQPRLSEDDAARVAIGHGFRVLARPVRNDDVFVAEVVDRRGMRERLIIAGDTGQILQRSFVDPGRMVRRYDDPSIPPGPIPPGRIPNENREPSLLSKLFGNEDNGDARAPQVDRPPMEPDRPVRQPRIRRPRLVEQAPGTLHDTPIQSAPLVPPDAAPVIAPRAASPAPVIRRAPAQAALPSPASTPPTATTTVTAPAAADRPTHSISTNPLAIPGSREQDEKAAKPAQAAGAPAEQAKAVPSPKPPVVKPPVPAAPANAVPVVPLD